jgi:hypothetical protein
VTRPIRVYVAGAYSAPTPAAVEANVHAAMDAGDILEDLGYVAEIPHTNHWRHLRHPRDYRAWMERTRRQQETCDVLLRLPGPSNGADEEVEYAATIGQPVFHSVRELVAAMESKEGWAIPAGALPVVDVRVHEDFLPAEVAKALDRSSGVLVPASWRGVTTQTKP